MMPQHVETFAPERFRSLHGNGAIAPGAQLICADITNYHIGAQCRQSVRITETESSASTRYKGGLSCKVHGLFPLEYRPTLTMNVHVV